MAGLRRWRDALVERNALQQGRYGFPLGSLANEFSDQDSIARTKLQDLFGAWHELFEGVLRRFQQDGVIPQGTDVAQLATGFVAAVQGGYLLAQTSRDVTPWLRRPTWPSRTWTCSAASGTARQCGRAPIRWRARAAAIALVSEAASKAPY